MLGDQVRGLNRLTGFVVRVRARLIGPLHHVPPVLSSDTSHVLVAEIALVGCGIYVHKRIDTAIRHKEDDIHEVIAIKAVDIHVING